MKSFFQKSEKKYLRKKSALIQDYMLAGMGIVSIGLFCNYYNNKLNPPDPEEDSDQNEIIQKMGVTDVYVHKIVNKIKVNILKHYASKGEKFIEEEQLKNLKQEQNQIIVKVLVPENKK